MHGQQHVIMSCYKQQAKRKHASCVKQIVCNDVWHVISRNCYSRCNAAKASKSAMQGHHMTNRMPSSVEAAACYMYRVASHTCHRARFV
jgi:hypothetical protein